MTLVNFNRPLLHAFFQDFPKPDYAGGRVSTDTLPAFNVARTENGYRLELALPGWQKHEVTLTHTDRQLTITGQKEKKEAVANEKFLRREFDSASFRHTFQLPKGLDADQTKASLADGVLTVEFGRMAAEVPAPRTITLD